MIIINKSLTFLHNHLLTPAAVFVIIFTPVYALILFCKTVDDQGVIKQNTYSTPKSIVKVLHSFCILKTDLDGLTNVVLSVKPLERL